MKILLISDLHTEHWSRYPEHALESFPGEYDVVVAAGDIGVGCDGVRYLLKTFPDKQIVYVPGNHEYYHNDINEVKDQLTTFAFAHDNLHVLNPGCCVIDGKTFIGATLWTDFKLTGYPERPHQDFGRAINDFRVIVDGDGVFTTQKCIDLFYAEREFIETHINGQYTRKDLDNTVVVTHFVPSQQCIDPKYLSEGATALNPYFNNDLDELMNRYRYPLHLYGHTHSRMDQIHPYGTRLVGNPYGYPREVKQPYGSKIIEV